MPNTILDKDLIIGFSSDGSLPFIDNADDARNLRWNGDEFIDCTQHRDWLIDDAGNKRLPSMHTSSGWQGLECAWNDTVVLDDDGSWIVETEALKLVAQKRDKLAAVVQMADRFTSSLTSKYPEVTKLAFQLKDDEALKVVQEGEKPDGDITAVLATLDHLSKKAALKGWSEADVLAEAKAVRLKADVYKQIVVEVEVMQETAEEAINSAVSLDELGVVSALLVEQANALAEQYNLK